MSFTKSNQNMEYMIAIAGDVFLQTIDNGDLVFGSEVVDLLSKIPLSVINLETVISNNIIPKEKAFNFRIPTGKVNRLVSNGVKVVNLANNHTLDYGVEGLISTIRTLQEVGINYFGVIQESKQTPFIFSVDGVTIGFLGYTIGENSVDSVGIAQINEDQIKNDIIYLRRQCIDRIIINLHWGEEYVNYPSPNQQDIARRIINIGADVIIGHHPHVVQGIERYRNGLIFYSVGNFNFINSRAIDQRFPGSKWGIMILLDFDKDTFINYICLPVHIGSDYRPSFPSNEKKEIFMEYLNDLSDPLIPKVGKLFWWRNASYPHFANHLSSFIYRINKYGAAHFIQMLRWLASPKNYGFYVGLILFTINFLIDQVIGKSRSKFSGLNDESNF